VSRNLGEAMVGINIADIPRRGMQSVVVACASEVLALQGAFREHVYALEALDVTVVAVRLPAQLDQCDGLIIPGASLRRSAKLWSTYEFYEPIAARHVDGHGNLGQMCGRCDLIAKQIRRRHRGQRGLELMDVAGSDVTPMGVRSTRSKRILVDTSQSPTAECSSGRRGSSTWVKMPNLGQVRGSHRRSGEGDLMATTFHRSSPVTTHPPLLRRERRRPPSDAGALRG